MWGAPCFGLSIGSFNGLFCHSYFFDLILIVICRVEILLAGTLFFLAFTGPSLPKYSTFYNFYLFLFIICMSLICFFSHLSFRSLFSFIVNRYSHFSSGDVTTILGQSSHYLQSNWNSSFWQGSHYSFVVYCLGSTEVNCTSHFRCHTLQQSVLYQNSVNSVSVTLFKIQIPSLTSIQSLLMISLWVRFSSLLFFSLIQIIKVQYWHHTCCVEELGHTFK